MTDIIQSVETTNLVDKSDVFEEFAVGDTVSVALRVVEGTRSRLQQFEGVVIGIRNKGIRSAIILRREASGVGVEKTLMLYSPLVEKLALKRRGKVRRAKLYYLRSLRGKAARIKAKV